MFQQQFQQINNNKQKSDFKNASYELKFLQHRLWLRINFSWAENGKEQRTKELIIWTVLLRKFEMFVDLKGNDNDKCEFEKEVQTMRKNGVNIVSIEILYL